MSLTLIVEPNPGGHRFQAVANVARAALVDGPVRVLTSGGATSREEYADYLDALAIEVEEPFDEPQPPTATLVAALREQLAKDDVGRIVVMEADDFLKTWWFRAWTSLRRRHRPEVIFFLTRWPARLESTGREDRYFWKIRVAKQVLVALSRMLGTLDLASGFAGRDERSPGLVVRSVRDPAQCLAHSRDSSEIRKRFGLPADRRLVGIFGSINPRKNPALALDAVLSSQAPVDLLLAGPMDGDSREWLAGLPPEHRARVVTRDAFLSSEELDSYVAAVDIVLLLMTLEGPSGIMGKALAADVPVLTAGSKTRVRELHALHRGLATEMQAEALGAGMAQLLADPPSAPETDLVIPTAETFGRSVLGVDGADPGLAERRTVLSVPRRIYRSIANRLRHRSLKAYLRPREGSDLVRLGSDHGGWWLPQGVARPGAVAYLGGAGEDITLDLELHERGCLVRTIDPTPRAIAYVQSVAPASDRFQFLPVGLWDVEDTIEFFAPSQPQFVSHSAVNLFDTEPAFTAFVKPVHQIMSEVGDDHVDILKLDIEGAEHRTLEALVANGPLPEALCVEFDQPQPLRRIVDRVRKLRAAGYELRKIEDWNYTFTRG